MITKYFRHFSYQIYELGWFLLSYLSLLFMLVQLIPLSQAVDVPGNDKLHYFLGFAALTYSLTVVSRRYWPSIIVFGLLFGALIEIIQHYVNRFGDVADLTADAVGVSIGFSFGVSGYFLKLKNDNLVYSPKQ